MLRFRGAGGTVVLTTHYMEEAERLCDRVAIIDHGRIIKEGSPAELIRGLGAAARDRVRRSRAAPRSCEADLLALPAVTGARLSADGVYALTVSEPARALPALIALVSGRGAALGAARDPPRDAGGRVRHADGTAPARWLTTTAARSHPVVQLTLMRLRELRREPGTLFWVFGFPILISIALGLAFRNTGPEPVSVGVLPGVRGRRRRARSRRAA